MNNLEVRKICKAYDDFKLKDVSFTVKKGKIMGLIGENGAGKTTTLKTIMELIKTDSGNVTILDHVTTGNLEKRPIEINEYLGVVMDESGFADTLTLNNIELIMSNIYKTWKKEVFGDYVDKFKLPRNKRLKDFSKGMKMKTSIAVALSHDSKLLILDEATSGLDPIVRDEVLEIFLDFVKSDNSKSILISSHITSDLEKICDEITFIREGKIVLSEDKQNLMKKYGVMKFSEEEYFEFENNILSKYEFDNSKLIERIRRSGFGTEILINMEFFESVKSKFENLRVERASLEDIMLFYCKGELI